MTGNTGYSWPPYRLRQFYLDVSNSSVDTSIKRSRVRCYTDNNTSPATPPPVIDIPCKQTARYVIVETTYHAPEDKDSIGPVLEICEIEVIGCNIRHFGENCALCNACSVCDVINGNCTALCSPYCVAKQCDTHGYCTLGCTEGYWGNKCQNFCPSFCHLKICNRVDGICNSCIDGYYGDRCEQLCNSKCSGQKCNKDTGFCTTGCVSGYYGSYCQDRCGNCGTGICSRNTGNCETCNKGVYGSQCDKKCSNNCLNKECRPIDGHCSNGCISGFYGSLCNMQCSENCVQTICSRNGVCINGCKPNWTGDKCAECSRTHHGPRCDQQCSPVCLNGTCFSDNGSCIEGCNINFIENFKGKR
ncbi:multiple epidermal growth factor-like domains protein 10 [Saccostrea cucullata]|uniref:multiple epidermal growth factor-like domains protein 10 n=1 Tax=Saccostrea cuccullata TaxID=36930 RepID=UPI002ED5DB03